ncbi:MAG: hypothetical protein EOO88_55000, partial [Pedobacter sp.]
MPGYSPEQFDPNFIRLANRPFAMEVFLRLQPKLSFPRVYQQVLKDLQDAFVARTAIVNEGFAACPNRTCPEGTAAFENWSTPSRDDKILQMIRLATNFIVTPLSEAESGALRDIWNAEQKKVYVSFDGRDYTFKQLNYIWAAGLYSSDPNDAPDLRWALNPDAFSARLQARLRAR